MHAGTRSSRRHGISPRLQRAHRDGAGEATRQSLLEGDHGETQIVLSAITVMELEHGWHRAQSPEAALERRRYLDEIFAVVPVEPFTREMGVLAAKIDAEAKKVGRVIATAISL